MIDYTPYILVVFVALVVAFVLIYFGHSVVCPHCMKYNYYEFIKPKKCEFCGTKLIYDKRV